MSRVFANGPKDRGSILGQVVPKTFKMLLDGALLNIRYYKVRIKCKVEQSREWSNALPYTSVLLLLKKKEHLPPPPVEGGSPNRLYPVMICGIFTIYPRRLNKAFKFEVLCRLPSSRWNTRGRPKSCEYKDEENCSNTLNDKNHLFRYISCEKFIYFTSF